MTRQRLIRFGFSVLLLPWAASISDADDVRPQALRLPESTLLSGWGGIDYLAVTTPTETIRILPAPNQPETRGYAEPVFASISRDGKLVACARLKTQDNQSYSSPFKVALATYTLPEKKWIEYTEADYIDAVAISPDNSKLAFAGYLRFKGKETREEIYVLDMKTRFINTLLSSKNISHSLLSWSDDGTRLAYEASYGHGTEIDVIEIETGKSSKLAEGVQPSWSPKGGWIAYLDDKGRCSVVRPDGSDSQVLAEIHNSRWNLFDHSHLFATAPVWSPDSSQVLLSEREESRPSTVWLVDVSSRKMKKIGKGAPVLGWGKAN